MSRNLKRIQRLVEELRLLQAGKGHNTNALAAACGVSQRTIFRDLDALRQAGVPLEFDTELERYSISKAFFLPPTNLTADESLAVLALCHEMGTAHGLPYYDAAQRAAAKIEGSLPANIRESIRPRTRAIRIRLDSTGKHDGNSYYEQLIDAIAKRCAVRIRYRSLAEGQLLVTKLSPYQVLFSRRWWYVIGRSSVHRETRTFHVGRIEHLEQLDQTFRIPRGFSVERYLGNAWHLVPEPGPDDEVCVRFQPQVAANVADVHWHKTQRCQWNDDCTLDFSVTVSGLQEISWWILGYGDQAEVLRPKRLRKIIAGHARRMAAHYQDDNEEA